MEVSWRGNLNKVGLFFRSNVRWRTPFEKEKLAQKVKFSANAS
jgi:hypothetical protein